MDQDKIGKLIAKLRKEKGMTQRELGDMVNVGFKAVSKWERGITCPDISIINELSKILGITSDELLTGELNPEQIQEKKQNKKLNKKILLAVALIIFVGLIGFIIYKVNNNKVDVYNLTGDFSMYYIDGNVVFKGSQIAVHINELRFVDKNFNKTMVKNYMYRIDCNGVNLAAYGYLLDIEELPNLYSIKDIMKNFSISYEKNINLDKNLLVSDGIVLTITFVDANDNLIDENIFLKLNKIK